MIELFLTVCLCVQEPAVPVQPLQFSVTHDGAAGESIDGRLYIMLTKGKLPLIGGPNLMRAEPFFALDVKDWNADIPLVLDDNADAMAPLKLIIKTMIYF